MNKKNLFFAGHTVTVTYPSELSGIINFLFSDCCGGEDDQPQRTVNVMRGHRKGEYLVVTQDHQARSSSGSAELASLLLNAVTGRFIDANTSGVVLHSAAVFADGRGIALPGSRGVGKSVLTAWLLTRGYQYLTDELICLPEDSLSFQSLSRPLNMKMAAMQTLSTFFEVEKHRDRFLEDEQTLLLPHDVFASGTATADPTLSLIIFPYYRHGERISLEVLTPAKTGLRLMNCLVNARNLEQHGFRRIAGISRQVPALALTYGDINQLEGVLDRIIPMVLESGLRPGELEQLFQPFSALRADVTRPPAPTPKLSPVPEKKLIPDATPMGPKKRLTIGMATYDDYDGVYFSVQAIRMYHPEVTADTEIIVIDNHPDGPCGDSLKKLDGSVEGYRYIPLRDMQGTAVRNVIFQEANADFVLCIDCHVLIVPGALQQLLDYLDSNPDCGDLVQGPIIYDDLSEIKTHFETIWRGGMYGTWSLDERGKNPDSPPFEIPMQGLGLFGCRKEVWPGFNPRFRGFGGEEGYIHEKFRQAGGRTLCLPFLRWLHRFPRPMGVPYRLRWEDRIHNYMVGFDELGLDMQPIYEHFEEHIGQETVVKMIDAVKREIRSPFFYFDAIYCITLDTARQRRRKMEDRCKALGIHERVRFWSAVATPENHHVGCTLSHRGIIAAAKKQGLRNVLVFEDDAIFLDNTMQHLTQSVEELQSQDWNIFYLGGHQWGLDFPMAPGCSFLKIPEGLTCTHALAYNSSVFDAILEDIPDDIDQVKEWLKDHFGIDQYLRHIDKLYISEPVVASQPALLPRENEEYRRRFTLGDE